MISTVGQYSLFLAIFVNVCILLSPAFISRSSRLPVLSFLLLTFSFFALIYSHSILDVSVINVYKTVNRYLPLFYRVGSSWGNHEGSMLLWCYIISLYQLYSACNRGISKTEVTYANRVMSLILIVFCTYTYISSNPFLLTYNELLDDKELNPVLQDPVLIIHPPIIYVGYLGSTLIYTYTLCHFRTASISLLHSIKRVAVFSWTLLSIGILLGSWWAYHELGWGGWWFWDPVENISLLPWLFLLLVIHNVSYLIKFNRNIRAFYIFSILTFLSSCYGTFFVRSGLITSIHSFASDNTRGIIILASLALFIMISLLSYLLRNRSENNSSSYVIYLYNTLLTLLLFVILLGTVFPSLYLYLINKEISIGASFYNDILVPWSLLFVTLILLYGQRDWSTKSIVDVRYITVIMVSTTITAYAVLYHLTINIIYQILVILILANITSIIYYIISNLSFRFREFAHLGFSISVLGMILSSNLEYEVVIDAFPGETFKLGDYLIIIKDINVYQNNAYYSLYVNILVDNGDSIISSMPEKRLYLNNLNVISKSVIQSNHLNDLYTLIGEGNDTDGWYFRVYLSEYINLIWLGGIILLIGYIIK